MGTAKFVVEGMHCPNCERKIKEALEAVDGVSAVLVDRENKLVAVTHELPQAAGETLKAVIETVHNNKFTVSGIVAE